MGGSSFTSLTFWGELDVEYVVWVVSCCCCLCFGQGARERTVWSALLLVFALLSVCVFVLIYVCVCVCACLFGNLRMLIRHSENSLKCLFRQHCPSPAGPHSLVAPLLLRTSLTCLLFSCLPMRSRHAAFALVVVLVPLSNVFQSHDRVCKGDRERERVAEPERGGKHGWPPPPPRANYLVCACVSPPAFYVYCVRACVSPVCVCVLRFECAAICVVRAVVFLSSKWLCLWRCLLWLPALLLPAAPVII